MGVWDWPRLAWRKTVEFFKAISVEPAYFIFAVSQVSNKK